MLAYVFWHWSSAPAAEYRRALLDFHRRLAEHGAPGTAQSFSYSIAALPWGVAPGACTEERAYEDWYLIEDFAALQPLSDAALSREVRAEHDRVAGLSRGGAGGLYRLLAGEADPAAPLACWLERPRGLEPRAHLDRLAGSGWTGALWQRQLVLGPAAEVCATGSRAQLAPLARAPGVCVIEREPVR